MTTVGSLCSGYGGLDLGLELAIGPVEHAWHVEYDKHPSAILAHRFPGVPNYGDVKHTDWTQVAPVDWLTAGYPCQPFSHAGKRQGEDDDRHLWPGVERAIRVLRPRRVLLENVAGHLSLGFGQVLGDLAALGYDTRWVCLRASDAGAPHRRERIFVLAADTRSGPLAGPAVSEHGLRLAPERGREPSGDAESPRDAQRAQLDGCGEGHHEGTTGSPGSATADTSRGDGWDVRRLTTESAPGTGSCTAPNADCPGCEAWDGRPGTGDARRLQLVEPGDPAGDVQWGAYEPAIRRWERVTERPAPRPTQPGRSTERLSPRFVEWMMGLSLGWVTEVPGIPRNAQLKALGNGVVPQQAALALRLLGVTPCEVAA